LKKKIPEKRGISVKILFKKNTFPNEIIQHQKTKKLLAFNHVWRGSSNYLMGIIYSAVSDLTSSFSERERALPCAMPSGQGVPKIMGTHSTSNLGGPYFRNTPVLGRDDAKQPYS
jgi:hypothetical protein